MIQNPWERLREAAQRVDREFEDRKGSVSGDAAYELSEALAALLALLIEQNDALAGRGEGAK